RGVEDHFPVLDCATNRAHGRALRRQWVCRIVPRAAQRIAVPGVTVIPRPHPRYTWSPGRARCSTRLNKETGMQTVRALGILLVVAAAASAADPPEEKTGLKVGEKAPAFKLKNQNGKERTLEEFVKEGKVALVFHRSASW